MTLTERPVPVGAPLVNVRRDPADSMMASPKRPQSRHEVKLVAVTKATLVMTTELDSVATASATQRTVATRKGAPSNANQRSGLSRNQVII